VLANCDGLDSEEVSEKRSQKRGLRKEVSEKESQKRSLRKGEESSAGIVRSCRGQVVLWEWGGLHLSPDTPLKEKISRLGSS
jgi:hypothetical protein